MSNLINSFWGADGTYLLDTYSNGVRAFSLRKIKSGVTYGIRVERADTTQVDVELYDDGSSIDLSSTVSSGGDLTTWAGSSNVNIVRWYDQIDGTHSTYVSEPSITAPQLLNAGVLNTKGGVAAIVFGSGKTLSETAITEMDSGNDFSVFTVASATSTATVGGIVTTNTTNTDRFVMWRDSRTTPNRSVAVGNGSTFYFGDLSAADTSTNQKLQVAILDGTAKGIEAFDDGATGGTDTWTGSYNNSTLYIGGKVTLFNGTIQEVIIFDAKKNGDRSGIEGNINTHYSIY